MDLRKLKRNAVIVAEALARFMYKLSEKVNKCTTAEHTGLNAVEFL